MVGTFENPDLRSTIQSIRYVMRSVLTSRPHLIFIHEAGLFSGNVAVMHSVLGEITDASNQAIAYPIYGLCWPLGVIIGYARFHWTLSLNAEYFTSF